MDLMKVGHLADMLDSMKAGQLAASRAAELDVLMEVQMAP